MIFPRAEQREEAVRTAALLRERGLNVELYDAPTKLARRLLRYASRRGIPYVWFPPFEEGGVHEVKHMAWKNRKHRILLLGDRHDKRIHASRLAKAPAT